MSHRNHIFNQFTHSYRIVRYDRKTVRKFVIDRHNRNIAFHQLAYLRIIEIDTGDHDAVQTTVPAMLQICFAFLVLLIAVDKGDIITFAFRGHFKAVQDICEIIMCQTAHRFINKENTNIKAFVHADRAGIILRKISLFLCDLFDMFFGFLSNILFVVQSFADRGNRHATNLRNVFN